MIRWPEIITPSAWQKPAVNGRRGGPPATHTALLLSCLTLLRPRRAVQSKALLWRPPSHVETAPEAHLVLKDGGAERAVAVEAPHRRSLLSGLP